MGVELRLATLMTNPIDEPVPRDPEQVRSKSAVLDSITTLDAVEKRALDQVVDLVAETEREEPIQSREVSLHERVPGFEVALPPRGEQLIVSAHGLRSYQAVAKRDPAHDKTSDHFDVSSAMESMNQKELVLQLASDRYSVKDCQALLRKGQLGVAAEYLRATDPQRALDLAVSVLQSAKYETQAHVLMKDHRLLDTPGVLFIKALETLVRAKQLDDSQRAALVRPLVEWFEREDTEHLDFLEAQVDGVKVLQLAQLATVHRPSFKRLWRLVEPKLGETFEEQATAVLETAQSPFVALAAEEMAATQGVELTTIGVPFSIGGVPREDVVLHQFKPMLELIWKQCPELLGRVLAVPCKAVRTWGIPWMLDFTEAEVSMVDAPPSRTIVLRSGRIVVAMSGTFKKLGRASVKEHKTDAAAAKDVEKRLSAAETKLAVSRGPWDGATGLSAYRALKAEGLDEALRVAVKRGQPADVESLLRRRAEPCVDPPLLPLASEYGVICRLLAAGATEGVEGALLAKVSWNPSGAYRELDAQACIALLEAGADATRVDRKGWNALHHAAHNGHLELVRALVDAGVDTALPTADSAGRTAAELADASGWHRVVGLLR